MFPIWFRFVSFNFRLLLKYRSLSVSVPFVPFVSFRSVPFCGQFPNLLHAAIRGEASFGSRDIPERLRSAP